MIVGPKSNIKMLIIERFGAAKATGHPVVSGQVGEDTFQPSERQIWKSC